MSGGVDEWAADLDARALMPGSVDGLSQVGLISPGLDRGRLR